MTDHDRLPNPWRPTRRDVLLFGLGGFLAAVPFARRPVHRLIRRNVPVMGTIAEFAVSHRDPLQAQAAIDAAIAALRDVDAVMSVFDPRSEISKANRAATASAVEIGEGSSEVLAEARLWAEHSGGAFDPCLGRPVDLWDVKNRHEPPPADTLRPFANRKLYRSLELGTSHGRRFVRFHDHDVRLDLGGIAKGYGVDRAVAALRAHGIRNALVGAGGDLYAMGQDPSGAPWTVGIQSPDVPGRLAGTLAIEDAAVATSGDYQQFFEYRRTRYHHLIDPITAAPRRTIQRSVSVLASTCMAADAGATLAFVMPRAEADGVLARHGARIVHSI